MSKHNADGGLAHSKNDSTGKGKNAANGSMRVTVVNGSTYVGLHAADGSTNVYIDNGSTPGGAYHKSGALRVTSNSGKGIRDPNGALRLPGIS